jgi:hypothetical protein
MKAKSGLPQPLPAASTTMQVPVRDVLSRAGHELVHLAWLLDNLQCQLSPLLQDAAGRDAGMLRQIQSFDHIGQIARGLEGFLAALAQETPPHWLVDPSAAAKNVSLAALSSRLGFTGQEIHQCATAWDECELF